MGNRQFAQDLWALDAVRVRDVRHHPREVLTALRSSDQDLVRVAGRHRVCAIVLRPALVDKVLSHGYRFFDKGAETTRFRFLAGDGNATSRRLPRTGGGSAHAESIAEWRRRRRAVFAQTFGAHYHADHLDRITAETAAVTLGWQHNEVRDIASDMYRLALRNFASCFAEPQVHDLLAEASRVAAMSRRALVRSAQSDPLRCPHDRDFDVATRLRQLSPDPTTQMVRRRRRAFQHIFTQVLQTAHQRRDPRSIFYLLSEAAADFPGTVPVRSLVSGSISIFLAGYENVSATLAWSLWCLAGAPDAQERLAQEAVNAESLQDSAYAQACLAETLRLHPPVWSIPREALADLRIGGYRIPKGAVLILSPWIQHFQPRYWQRAEQFLPERFLDGGAPTPGSYYPFGAGPRKCQGMNFANRQLLVVLAAILREWRLCRVPDVQSPQDWFGVVQRPDGPVPLRVKRR